MDVPSLSSINKISWRRNFKTKVILASLVSMSVLFACNKTKDVDVIETTSEVKTIAVYDKTNLPAELATQLNTQPITMHYPMNEKMQADVLDELGNKVVRNSNVNGQRSINECDPGFADFQPVLTGLTKEFLCGNGYRFTFTYSVSTNSDIVLNDTILNRFTNMQIRLKTSTSAAGFSYTSARFNANSIVNLGTSPLYGADYDDYTVTFTSPFISASTYNGSPFIYVSAYFSSSCANLVGGTISNNPLNTFFQNYTTVNPNGTPCARADGANIQPYNTGVGAGTAYANGCNVLGNCTVPGYVVPNAHQFQYRLVGSTNWIDLYSTVATYVKSFEVKAFSLPLGNYEFRHRNIMFVTPININNPTVSCSGPWSPTFTRIFN